LFRAGHASGGVRVRMGKDGCAVAAGEAKCQHGAAADVARGCTGLADNEIRRGEREREPAVDGVYQGDAVERKAKAGHRRAAGVAAQRVRG